MLEKTETDENGEEKKSTFPILRYYNVFHVSQIDGVEPKYTKIDMGHDPIESAEKVVKGYVDRDGKLKLSVQESDKAYYSPMLDTVVVPRMEQFKVAEEYYSTLFHELTHSTGHESRLSRLGDMGSVSLGNEEYSKEELVAEIGSATLMNHCGIEIEKTFRNSVAYIENWLSVLKNDRKFIVSASSKASKAVELILGGAE